MTELSLRRGVHLEGRVVYRREDARANAGFEA